MVALYRSGRQAEARRAFQRARTVLVDELGIEPGATLRDLDRAIAAQDDSLGAGSERAAGDDRYRVTMHEAGHIARETGDDEALVVAVMGAVRRSGARASAAIDQEVVELLEIAAARARDDRVSALLLSALGQELSASPEPAQPRA